MKHRLNFLAPPLILTAAVLAVVGSQSRYLATDKICLLVVVALASALYIRKRWLAVLAFGFAAGLLIANADLFGDGPLADLLKRLAEHKIPAPRVFDPRDFVDNLDHQAHVRRIDQEVSLYGYLLATAVVFAICLIGDGVLRSGFRSSNERRSGKRLLSPEGAEDHSRGA